MPVINMNGTILIAHDKAGIGEEIEHLGEMSTELAIWLEGKLFEHSLPTIAPKLQNTATGETVDYWDKTNIVTNPYIRSMIARCALSAQRGYRHPYSDTLGNLTPLGLDKANQVQQIIQIINDDGDFWAYQPQKWTKATDVLIKATIPTRALSLLLLIQSAIIEAEKRYNAYALEHPGEAQDPHSPDILNLNTANPINPTDRPKVFKGERRVADFYEVEIESAVTQDVSAMLYLIGTRRREAWVPSATFGQRARSDLKYLVRFGLVDLKAYVAGGRGRPRHVLRVSPTGQIVLDDLLTRKILTKKS